MKSVWKIRHIPTGLFWIPVQGYGSKTTNLSKTGKIYARKPSIESLIGFNQYRPATYRHEGVYVKTNRADWELVEYEIIMKEVSK